MAKQYHNLSLAKSPEEYKNLEHMIMALVNTITGHGEPDKAEALYALLDLTWNDKYRQNDRDIVSHTALRFAFSQTEAFEQAMETEAGRLNPVALRKAS